jgi:hypothetical protein
MSSIAAEGMFNIKERSLSEVEVNGFIENNSEAFAKKAIELHTNSEIWNQNQLNGFRILNKRFNTTDFESDFSNRISQLHESLKKHRQNNFIGQLFMHQTLQSTKYMSKWIEAKNG